MSGSDDQHEVKPSEQRGGTNPGAEDVREKGAWVAHAEEGIVPSQLGGSDAPEEMLDEDPELRGSVLGATTGSDEPATKSGIDLSAGENADATSQGGPEVPEQAEPDLKDLFARECSA